MTSYVRDGTVGPWAAEKLACLGKYLSAYTTILRKQSDWCRGYYYIDAFAGAGRARLRNLKRDRAAEMQPIPGVSAYGFDDQEKLQYVDGSPRTALNIDHPFTHYYFIDNDAERIAELHKLKTEYAGTRNISVLKGDANAELLKLPTKSNIDWRWHRGLVFLDPFGMQVPWETLETLARTRALEAFISFPAGMAIQRLLHRSGQMSQRQKARLTQYMGSPEWESVVYETTPDLFGGDHISKVEKSGDRLANWYQGRLTRSFGYGARPRLIRNSQGGHLYYLLFAGPKESGANIAQDILIQGEAI